MCRTSRAASAWTTASAASSCTPGPGYGGSCFPKDTLALIKTGQDADAPMRIVETVAAVNDQRKRGMAKKVIAACGGSVRGKTIALLGLAFKPNTDDMRDAPSLAIVTALRTPARRCAPTIPKAWIRRGR